MPSPLQRLRQLFGPRPDFPITDIAPQTPLAVIGDIHGRLDLLETALANLADNETGVLVGDYIDRGANSQGVLRHLFAQTRENRLICLKGNHEQMMLQALAAPEKHMIQWLHHGGERTLESFGISLKDGTTVTALAERLTAAVGPELIAWITSLPSIWISGNVSISHAGADPHTPIALQRETHLLWGHADLRKQCRRDGIWVVHGHWIVETPEIRSGVIAIDTGAYKTDCLTTAHITKGQVRFTRA